MMDADNYDVFISYSRKDSAIVQPVVERLKSNGYTCWMDVNGIESGDAFKRVLVRAIRRSSLVLFFSSINSNHSEWTVKEINIAVEMNKTIVPVRLDDASYDDSIMFDLSGLDFVPFQTLEMREEGLTRLIRAVAAKCGADVHPPVVTVKAQSATALPVETQLAREASALETMMLTLGESKILNLPGGATMEMIYCSPGGFAMGSQPGEAGRSDDEIIHLVNLTKGFWLGKYEVTQQQWKSVMGSNPSFLLGNDMCPVEQISWDDCQDFICKVNGKLHCEARLPTEAEWEYASRAGSMTAYSWGNALKGDMANCDGNYPCGTVIKGPYLQTTTPVGRYGPNHWGFCDMHGNVLEWCNDWYDSYMNAPAIDPSGPDSGGSRILRGGCWSNSARYCRSASRYSFYPGNRSSHYGFRLCCSAEA